MEILANKLKNLKFSLRDWNQDVFWKYKKNISQDEQNLSQTKKLFDSDPSLSHRENLHNLKALYLSHLKNEEIFWKYKSRFK